MRWDRLFGDLEGQLDDLDRAERDALADELRDGDWAETRWRELLGGRVVLEVLGGARIEGEVILVNDRLLQIRDERIDHIVAAQAVVVVHAAQRRADATGRVAASLGWGHVFRALRDAGDDVMVRLADGSSWEGRVELAGADFVRLRAPAGRTHDVVWAHIVSVSGRT